MSVCIMELYVWQYIGAMIFGLLWAKYIFLLPANFCDS